MPLRIGVYLQGGLAVAFLGLSLPFRWFYGGSVAEAGAGIRMKGFSSPDSRAPIISMSPHLWDQRGLLASHETPAHLS